MQVHELFRGSLEFGIPKISASTMTSHRSSLFQEPDRYEDSSSGRPEKIFPILVLGKPYLFHGFPNKSIGNYC
jgi:hypothetical protein